jgi:hypothetical protein
VAHEENAGNRELIKSQISNYRLTICIGREKESCASVVELYAHHPIVIQFCEPTVGSTTLYVPHHVCQTANY